MNLRKKSKKAILSSLIALALSSSATFAMPQGGSVVAGNVNGVTAGSLQDLVNNGTLNVNGNSLIDWKSFSIGQNETLNVIFSGQGGNMLINHVTGSDISQLLGILNAKQGEGGFMLINPNGIVVGPQAQLNVGSLIMSTLDVSNENLLDVMKNGGMVEYKDTKNGVLDIQGGKISVEDTLNLYGAKIRIADGVTISNDLQLLTAEGKNQVHPLTENRLEDATIVAANSIKQTRQIIADDSNHSMEIVSETDTLTPENTVEIGHAHFSNEGKEFSVAIGGGKVTMNKTQFGTFNEPLSEVHLAAVQSDAGDYSDKDKIESTTTLDNVLTLNNTYIHVKPAESSSAGMALDGGVINIHESQLQADDKAYMKLRAFTNMTESEADGILLKNSTANKVIVDNSQLRTTDCSLGITAGNIQINRSNLMVQNGALRLSAVETAKLTAYNEKKRTEPGEVDEASVVKGNNILISNNSLLSADISKDRQYVLQKDQNHWDMGRMIIGAYSIEARDSIMNASDRIEVFATSGADSGNIIRPADDNGVIMRNMKLSGGDITLTGKKVSLLGKSEVLKPNDRYFVAAAGSKVILDYGSSKYDKDTYTSVKEADGEVELSQTTKDNLEKANVLTHVENYKVVAEIPQPETKPEVKPASEVKPQPATKPEVKPAPEVKPQPETKPEVKPAPEVKPQPETKPEVKPVPEVKPHLETKPETKTSSEVDVDKTANAVSDILKDKNMSNAQKQAILLEKKPEIRAAVNAMEKRDGVRGQMDKAVSAAPAASETRPAATNTETANVTAGEGVTSKSESAVTGVEEK